MAAPKKGDLSLDATKRRHRAFVSNLDHLDMPMGTLVPTTRRRTKTYGDHTRLKGGHHHIEEGKSCTEGTEVNSMDPTARRHSNNGHQSRLLEAIKRKEEIRLLRPEEHKKMDIPSAQTTLVAEEGGIQLTIGKNFSEIRTLSLALGTC